MRLPSATEKRVHLLRLLLFALFCTVLYHVLAERQATVVLDLRSSGPTLFKLYWLNHPDEPWHEDHARRVPLREGEARYTTKLTDLAKIAVFRIDPSEKPADVCIRSITIVQNGYAPIHLAGNGLTRLTRGEGIEAMRLTDEGLLITPATIDPQLFFDLPGERRRTAFWGGEFGPLGAVFLFALLGGAALSRFLTQINPENDGGDALVPLCLAVVLALITAMATVSKVGAHPDELMHIQAGDYYQHHVLPPPVGDEAIRHTYSPYGVSRLHSGEAAYFFLGKFARAFQALGLQSFMAQRLGNICLWALLLCLALARGDFRLLMVPALLSPQIWYIFSYVNSEAFAVFVMMLAAWQLGSPDSTWNRLLAGEPGRGRPVWIAVLFLGLLLALLLLLKKNFDFFLLFAGLYCLWRVVFGHTRLNRANLRRIAAVALVGLGLFAAVRGVDQYVNGFHKSEKMLLARYRLAEAPWNPGTPLEKRHGHLQMRERGVSLRQMLEVERWGAKSFRSAVGMYGFTSVSAAYPYYRLFQYMGLFFLLAVSAAVLAHGGLSGISLWGLTLGASCALIGYAGYHAWTVDFQPQGRYFLPIVGMLGLFCLEARAYLSRSLLAPLACAGLFLLSLYSFVWVALPGILPYP